MVHTATSVVLVLLNVFNALAVEKPPVQGILQDVRNSMTRYQAMMKQEKTVATTPTGARVETYEDDGQTVDLLAIMSDCNETFRIETDYLISLNESGSFPDETDKTPKCYLRCLLERAGAVSAEGVFDVARAAAIFADSRPALPTITVEEMAAVCALREESCKCERSYNFVKCLLEAEIRKSVAS